MFVATACGVPVDGSPRSIDRDDIPIELLSPAPSVTTSTTVAAALTEVIEIYLVRSERLFAVPRTVPTPLSGPKVLDTLSAGPTADETATGLRTAISRRANLVVVAVTGAFARVELDQAVVGLQGRDQLLAIGQIVYTLASLQDIDGVEFSFRGALLEVPTGRGTLKSGPVTTADYAALEPR
jgi:spore germination protein GerM